jgi:hypothetical protein
MNQVHEATGPDSARMQRWLVLSPQSDPNAQTLIESLKMRFILLDTPDDPIASVTNMRDSDHYWYLADPLNAIMIRFPTPKNEADAITEGKGALKDIKRLLKVSKIG